MSEGFILFERDGAVATVTFNRPERLNAFVRSMYQELEALLGELERDGSIRVAILTGRGRAFCAGEDLKELAAEPEGPASLESVRETIETLQSITRRIVSGRIVYIAALNGVAAGFGAELAIACDLRLGSPDARLLFPEVRRGLFVTNGVTYLLPRIVGTGRAMELLLVGQPIDASAAERSGLLQSVVPAAELLSASRELAGAIAANAPGSVQLTKRALREAANGDLESALRRETELALRCFEEGAHREGAAAFVAKRDAKFD